MFSKNILSQMKLVFKKDRLFVFYKNEFRTLLELQHFLARSYDDTFLSLFFKNEVIIEEDVDIVIVLKNLNPFKKIVENISEIEINDYLRYFNDIRYDREGDIVKIEFSKTNVICNIFENTYSFQDAVKNNDLKNWIKDKIKTEDYTVNKSKCLKLHIEKNQKKSVILGGEPLIDVREYIGVPLFLNNYGDLHGSMINENTFGVRKKIDHSGFRKNPFEVRTKETFTLYDFLECISSLLYFKSPLSQEETQENFQNFSSSFENVTSGNFKTYDTCLWEDFILGEHKE